MAQKKRVERLLAIGSLRVIKKVLSQEVDYEIQYIVDVQEFAPGYIVGVLDLCDRTPKVLKLSDFDTIVFVDYEVPGGFYDFHKQLLDHNPGSGIPKIIPISTWHCTCGQQLTFVIGSEEARTIDDHRCRDKRLSNNDIAAIMIMVPVLVMALSICVLDWHIVLIISGILAAGAFLLVSSKMALALQQGAGIIVLMYALLASSLVSALVLWLGPGLTLLRLLIATLLGTTSFCAATQLGFKLMLRRKLR